MNGVIATVIFVTAFVATLSERNCSSDVGTALSSCPPGLFCENGECKCGVYPHKLLTCNGTTAFIHQHCMATFNEKKNVILIGYDGIERFGSHNMYIELPRNISQLNGIMCSSTNRTGALCGRCLPDHYPLAYSFDVTCIPCPHARWNWVRYIMAAYLPLTLFYIVIVFFKINIISSHLFSPVLFCQIVTMPLIIHSVMPQINNDFVYSNQLIAKSFIVMFGIWNLDFGRPFYTDLCLGIGILPTLALDYAIAVYPLLLIIISYLLVSLYDKNYRIIVFLSRPLQLVSTLLKREWNVRTSLIDAFGALFFFSNVKFISVSFVLLIPVKVYQLYPDHYNYTLGLYYAGDTEYFGKEHLPYALLAIAVMCVFAILPMILLALYPFRWFQSFLNLLPVRWYILHTFVDSFYGYYKNGTQPGVRDYRWCSFVFFFLRFSQFLLYAVFEDKLNYNIVVSILLILYIVFYTITQPFSIPYYNTINTVFLNLLSLFSLSIIGITVSAMLAAQYTIFFFVLCLAIGACTLLYFFGSLIYWIYTQKEFAIDVLHRFRTWRNG